MFFDVVLTNKSTRRVTARIRKKENQREVKVDKEALRYCCSVQVRRVTLSEVEKQVHWVFSSDMSAPGDDGAVNLIDEYEYEEPGKPDFWLEPNETCHLCAGMHLERGIYHAMVTFVGKRDADFWRRMHFFQVPDSDHSVSKKGAGQRQADKRE